MRRKLPDYMREFPEWDRTQLIIKSFYATYNELGYGFLESVYRNALAGELRELGMHVVLEAPTEVLFRGRSVGMFRVDVIVDGCVIVELKAGAQLGPTDKRQLLNYLRSTRLDVGLLLHYGPKPSFQRVVSPRVILLPHATHPASSGESGTSG